MELHQLRCFLAVVDAGGFSKATSQLHISQPALSYQIKQLEQELSAKLFHRRPGGVDLTDAGRVLAKHTAQVMESVRKARRAVEELAEGVVGEVRIGTANSVGIYFLPRVLWSMREKYPNASPSVLYRHSNEIIDLLLSNQLDIALAANPKPDRRLKQVVLIEERVSLVCGRTHPFFGRESVDPSELEGAQFVSLTPKSPTGRLIEDYLNELEVNVSPVVYTDNTETVKRMVEVGLGVAFLPDMVTSTEIRCDGAATGRLARIEVGPILTRTVSMVTWKHAEINRATDVLMQELSVHADSWKGCGQTWTPEVPHEAEGEVDRAADN